MPTDRLSSAQLSANLDKLSKSCNFALKQDLNMSQEKEKEMTEDQEEAIELLQLIAEHKYWTIRCYLPFP